jgi:hypothetical protein
MVLELHITISKKMIPSVLLLPVLTLPLLAADSGSFVLTDYLNRAWSNECVEFPLSPAQAAEIAAGKALAGPDGQPVPFQVVTGAPARVAFLSDLAPFETRAYRFTNDTPSVQTDLVVEETSDRLRLLNGQIGISIRKTLQAGQGPIEKMRLKSGRWVGASRLDLAATGYTVQVVSQGPVFAEAVCRAEFGGESRWELRLRLNAREPVVLVDETMTLGVKSGVFSMSLSDDFAPDKVFYRDGKNAIGQNIVADIQPGNVFTLEPWLRWWVQPAEGPVFSVYKDAGTDLLAVGASEAGLWVDPDMPEGERAAPRAQAVRDGQGLHLDFVLRNGKRKWMLMALDKAACLAAMAGPEWPYITPLPHQVVIKHGQFPLDTVKDYMLEWSGVETNHPSLLITRTQAQEFRASVTNPAVYESQIPGFLADAAPLNQHTMGGRILAYMATGSRDLEQKLTDQAVAMLQQSVETFLTQPDSPYGAAPHHHWGQFMGAAPQLIDAILGGASITLEQRRRILAQLAFIGYTINRPDYWSPERDYSGNPNMTTSVLGYRMAYACVIPSHPKAREWAASAAAGLRGQLFGWSDSNGGWLEAPHYAMASYDPILASFLMAYRAGMNELVFDPQMKKVINWFSKISTPPDSRAQNRRHLPPVGNTYIGEPTGEFGLLAFVWKERDPAFAAEMQWMFRRQGLWPEAGLGGSYPGFAGYREMLRDPALPESAPLFASELFANVGVMLRSGFPSERETQLLLLAGSFGGWRSHWDDDSGSFTFWGKGRIVADDFGYYGAAPIEDHSLLDAPGIRLDKIFNVTTFEPSGYFDYVSGLRGPWRRQIAFVKDPDPLAPQFFVVADTYADNSANDLFDARTGTHTTFPYPGPAVPSGTLIFISEQPPTNAAWAAVSRARR